MGKNDIRKVSFLLPASTYESVQKLSIKNLISPSEQIRQFIDKGLSIQSLNDDMQTIQDNIQVAIDNNMSGYMDRIIALVVKNTIVGASAWFMNIKAMENLIPPHLQEDFDECMAFSKKAGVAYVKVKDIKESEIFKELNNEVNNEPI